MMQSDTVALALNKLVVTDPTFVEGVLKKCWKNDLYSRYVTTDLPKQLLKLGHSNSIITTYALQLLNSKYIDLQGRGLELMIALAEVSTKELPVTFVQISQILQNSEVVSSFKFETFELALSVLEAIMKRGGKLESFVPNLMQLLKAKKPFSDNGLKVLDLLAKNRDNYPNEFREGIVREIKQLVLPEAIKASVDARLSSIVL